MYPALVSGRLKSLAVSGHVPAGVDWRRCTRRVICWQIEGRSKMSITPEHKAAILAQYALQPGDTGSPEVQIAVLTAEIQAVTEHLQTHPKDYSGRRGLLSKVSRRRQLLDYLKRQSVARYQSIIGRLNIRK